MQRDDRFPDGLGPLIKHVHGRGMRFGGSDRRSQVMRLIPCLTAGSRVRMTAPDPSRISTLASPPIERTVPPPIWPSTAIRAPDCGVSFIPFTNTVPRDTRTWRPSDGRR